MARKSHSVNLVLVVLFGPVGLLYASVWQALVLMLVAVFVVGLLGSSAPVGLAVVWLLALAVGVSAVRTRNAVIDAKDELEERRHQELIAATRAATSSVTRN